MKRAALALASSCDWAWEMVLLLGNRDGHKQSTELRGSEILWLSWLFCPSLRGLKRSGPGPVALTFLTRYYFESACALRTHTCTHMQACVYMCVYVHTSKGCMSMILLSSVHTIFWPFGQNMDVQMTSESLTCTCTPKSQAESPSHVCAPVVARECNQVCTHVKVLPIFARNYG